MNQLEICSANVLYKRAEEKGAEVSINEIAGGGRDELRDQTAGPFEAPHGTHVTDDRDIAGPSRPSVRFLTN